MLPHPYVENVLAHHAAPCLAGIKPSNLVSFPNTVVNCCRYYNTQLNNQGIYFFPLCMCKTRSNVLIYRKTLLEHYFSRSDVCSALQYFGYNTGSGLDHCIQQLKQNMSNMKVQRSGNKCSTVFPHEIGLFLGYPVQDVLQYMVTGGSEYLFCGYWKVYSDPEKARKLFAQYNECKEQFALQIQSGMSIYDIICAA